MPRVLDCIADFGVPKPTEWQRIGNEIDPELSIRDNQGSGTMPSEIKKEIQLEIAHVLFIDIVGYSKLLLMSNVSLGSNAMRGAKSGAGMPRTAEAHGAKPFLDSRLLRNSRAEKSPQDATNFAYRWRI